LVAPPLADDEITDTFPRQGAPASTIETSKAVVVLLFFTVVE